MSAYGLDELYCPIDAKDAKIDIVFVHGLSGHRRETWTKNSILWPQELLPTDIPNARILTFGYEAAVVDINHEVSQSTMETHAADICDRLAVLRAGTPSSKRSIVFVVHSLGGLVCAQVITRGASAVPTDNPSIIAQSTRGIVFLGTPFHGSPSAKYGEVVRRIIGTFYDTNTKKIRDLTEKSEKLETLVEAFASRLRQRLSEGKEIGVCFFSETLKTHGILVVPEDNARIIGCGDHASIYANHVDMCKFTNKDDKGYKSVVAAIKKLAAMETAQRVPKGAMTNIWNNSNSTRIRQQMGQ